MANDQKPTTTQLRSDIDTGRAGSKVDAPDLAAAPLGTDDEAAGAAPSSYRVVMARKVELKMGDAAERKKASRRSAHEDDDLAHSQRGSSSPYASEDHMNQELVERSASQHSRQDEE